MKYMHKDLQIVIDSDFAWSPMIDYKNTVRPDIYIGVTFDQLKSLWFFKVYDDDDE